MRSCRFLLFLYRRYEVLLAVLALLIFAAYAISERHETADRIQRTYNRHTLLPYDR